MVLSLHNQSLLTGRWKWAIRFNLAPSLLAYMGNRAASLFSEGAQFFWQQKCRISCSSRQSRLGEVNLLLSGPAWTSSLCIHAFPAMHSQCYRGTWPSSCHRNLLELLLVPQYISVLIRGRHALVITSLQWFTSSDWLESCPLCYWSWKQQASEHLFHQTIQ